ncbi:MAG: hypothetical protein AB7T49_14170 [Oligoflexales bacterium]
MRLLSQIGAVLMTSLLTMSCTDKKDDDTTLNDDKEEDKLPEPDEDDKRTEAEGLTEGASEAIAAASETMVPGSLILDAEALRLEGDNPCDGTNGFFDCQPNLLKLYLSIGKMMVDLGAEITGIVGAELEGKTGVGSIDVEDDEVGSTTVDYNITSESKYKLIFSSELGPFVYISVDGSNVDLHVKGENLPPEEGDEEGAPGDITMTLDYTDEDTFETKVQLEMGCDDEDVKGPGRFAIDLVRTEGVTQGKAMMYHPRWIGEATCETESTVESSMFIYTDFVGDDTNTTAALYLLSGNATSTDEFEGYAASEFCNHWVDECDGGGVYNGDSEVVADTYKNNICITADEAEWDTTCESDSDLVSTPTFSDAALWIVPSDLMTLEPEFPESVED